MYLALTGHTLGMGDLLYTGLATHAVSLDEVAPLQQVYAAEDEFGAEGLMGEGLVAIENECREAVAVKAGMGGWISEWTWMRSHVVMEMEIELCVDMGRGSLRICCEC